MPAIARGLISARLSGRLLELEELSALEQKQQVEIIPARVCWLLICSLPALSRVKFPIRSRTGKAVNIDWSSKEAVLEMEVTPTVLQQNHCAPETKLRIAYKYAGSGSGSREMAKRNIVSINKEIETQVEVRSGETLALGGIFSQKEIYPRQYSATGRHSAARPDVSSRRQR